jgi:hypothetical protein
MDLMTPEENDEFNRIERESASVRREAIQASLWRKRHLDGKDLMRDVDLLTDLVRNMSRRITELEQQLMQLDTLPTTSPTERVEDDDDTQIYIT